MNIEMLSICLIIVLPFFLLFGWVLSKREKYLKFVIIIAILLLGFSSIEYAININENILVNTIIYQIIDILAFYLILASAFCFYLCRDSSNIAIKKKRKGKLFYLMIIILIILSFLQAYAIFKGQYIDHGDSGFVNYTPSVNNNVYLASQVSQSGIISVTFGLFNLSLFWIFGHILGAELFCAIIFAIASIGMFSLVYELTDGNIEIFKLFGAICSSIIFTFYLYIQYGPSHILPSIFLPYTILALIFLYKKINQKTEYRKELVIFSLFLILLFGLGGLDYLLVNLSIIALISMFLIYKSDNKKLLFISIIFALLLGILVLMPNIISYFKSSNGYFISSYFANPKPTSFSVETLFSALGFTTLPNICCSVLLSVQPVSLFATIVEIIIFLIGILALINVNQSNLQKAVIAGTIFTLIPLIFFYVNTGLPFGSIFSKILSKVPELLIFKLSDPILFYLQFFIISLLFGIGAINICEFSGKKGLLVIAIILLIAPIMIHIIYYDTLQIQKYPTFIIPSYALQTANYINSNAGDSSIAILPYQGSTTYATTYYQGTNIFSYLINKSVYTGGYSASGGISPENNLVGYANIANSIQSEKIYNSTYISELESYNIKYIIVEHDVPSLPSPLIGNYISYNISDIYYNLNESKGIGLVATFPNISIYELPSPAFSSRNS